MSGRWTPGIGDPSVLGWVTVVAYLAAAVTCALAVRRGTGDARSAQLWALLALAMLLLGINKQLDLQSLLTQVVRDVAEQSGWYGQRRTLQAAFILGVAAAGGLTILLLWRSAATLQRNIRYALAGIVFVFTYVVIRAASFHHVDIFIHSRLFGAQWNWIFELSGVGVILIAGWREQRAGSVRRRYPR